MSIEFVWGKERRQKSHEDDGRTESAGHHSGMQSFRDLNVWARANELAPKVRNLTTGFPKTGYRSLREQIIGAAESIPFNIAEGCGASTQKEFARFLDIAVKSATELEAELELAMRYGIVPEPDIVKCSDEVVEIRKMLRGLRKRVLESL